MGAPPVPESVKAAVQAAVGGPVIRCGGFERASGDRELAAGRTDLVAFGRPYLANADLVAPCAPTPR